MALDETRQALLEANSRLQGKKDKLTTEVDTLGGEVQELDAELNTSRATLDELDKTIILKQADINAQVSHAAELKQQVEVLENQRRQVNLQLSALDNEVEAATNKVAELEELYKTRKTVFDKQIVEAEAKLDSALAKLRDTEQRDQATRRAWAEGQLALEKREKVVRKREQLVADSDSRLKAHDDFMRI